METFIIILNLLICSAGGFIVICRMRFMDNNTKPFIRYHYCMWLPLFCWSAISWTYGDMPGWSQLALSFGGFMQLIMGSAAWRRGAPEYSIRRGAE